MSRKGSYYCIFQQPSLCGILDMYGGASASYYVQVFRGLSWVVEWLKSLGNLNGASFFQSTLGRESLEIPTNQGLFLVTVFLGPPFLPCHGLTWLTVFFLSTFIYFSYDSPLVISCLSAPPSGNTRRAPVFVFVSCPLYFFSTLLNWNSTFYTFSPTTTIVQLSTVFS